MAPGENEKAFVEAVANNQVTAKFCRRVGSLRSVLGHIYHFQVDHENLQLNDTMTAKRGLLLSTVF